MSLLSLAALKGLQINDIISVVKAGRRYLAQMGRLESKGGGGDSSSRLVASHTQKFKRTLVGDSKKMHYY